MVIKSLLNSSGEAPAWRMTPTVGAIVAIACLTATYAVFTSLDLATNVPSGSLGIGGSPGESVFVKAGASIVEPVAEGENLRMNIDKGNQANGGESMVVLGNVAHPEVVGEEYRIKSLDNADNPVNATTDAKGGLWLIVGTVRD